MKLTKKITALVMAASMTITGIITPGEVTVKAGETAASTAAATAGQEPTETDY